MTYLDQLTLAAKDLPDDQVTAHLREAALLPSFIGVVAVVVGLRDGVIVQLCRANPDAEPQHLARLTGQLSALEEILGTLAAALNAK